ncbi:Na+/Pi symporter [Elasticomyces elasticus]|nr:Na+/Pi symporter [Elasticomyces elasticus]KAK3660914.1 Na+/Pi symporter [Elasticomyces elasticus]KAK4932320.1 Na+/Pi symporter [Elasticomyces elasticus]KAK5768328.1 Na+/Pi symporter [Elasticomyces elasticus]
MAVLHQYDFLFAFGLIFSFLDAWNIGANDVANSFATSVLSRSLTMRQAMAIANLCEFVGAVLVGSRVADTIRSKILSVAAFEQDPAMLMLGMVCALVASSTYLTFATKIGLPVSTTHCIIGGVIGVGTASLGADGVNWGWKGVSQVFAAWVIAPGVAGIFGAIVFTISKYTILKRKNPLKFGLIMMPIFFAFTAGVLVMVIVWKGAPSLDIDDWSAGQILGCIFGVAGAVAVIVITFLIPYLYRKLILDDWQLKLWHLPLGPLLLRRGHVPERPVDEQVEVVQDYYRGHKTAAQLQTEGVSREVLDDMENNKGARIAAVSRDDSSSDDISRDTPAAKGADTDAEALPWYQDPKNQTAGGAFKLARNAFFHGVNVDVVAEQNKKSILAGDLEKMHAHAQHFDNKAEHLFSYLQVMTAATASFAHGANDVSNAVGPLATIFLVWNTGTVSSKAPVPIWVLCLGGAAIVIGLWTYGYNMMHMLGNRLTLHSPSRGFSMEFGAALTVVMATRLALPISTTQCIPGATVGVVYVQAHGEPSTGE